MPAPGSMIEVTLTRFDLRVRSSVRRHQRAIRALMDAIGSREIAPATSQRMGTWEGAWKAVEWPLRWEAMEDQKAGYRGTLSMCSRRVDAGPVSAVTILPAVNKRSMAARKASADTPFDSGRRSVQKGALRSIRV